MNNQNGFATLEIILIIAIIAILSTVAVPKMARILDKVALNYEMKHLYSELNLTRTLNESAGYNVGIFTGGNYKRERVNFRINYNVKMTWINFTRDGKSDYNFRQHYLFDGISFDTSKDAEDISLNASKTIKLKSRFGDKSYIKINSVGRVRGTYVE